MTGDAKTPSAGVDEPGQPTAEGQIAGHAPVRPGSKSGAPPATRALQGIFGTHHGTEKTSGGKAAGGSAVRRQIFGQIGVPLFGLVLIGFFATQATNFLTGANIRDVLAQSALPLIVAIGLTICLSMGEFDLSLNGVAGLASVTIAVLLVNVGVPTGVAVLIVLVIGAVVGALNGVLVGYVGLAALIVTIAMNSLLEGMQFVVSGNTQIFGGFPPDIVNFARGDLAGIPNLIIVAVLVAGAAWILLERSTAGRQIRAVGGNAEAARIAGVNVPRIKLIAFMLTAILASLAGLLFSAKQTNAFPLSGLDVLLPSFAACFLGAAMFKLGEFNVPGTIVGVLIAQITANGLTLMSVETYAIYFFQGGILLIAVLFARLVGGGKQT